MQRARGGLATFIGAIALCAVALPASADIPVGYVAWDVTFPGNAGEFDIVNLTGPNSLVPDLPVTTPLNMTNLNLVVNFSDGTSETFGPASGYFTLASDGLSYDGNSIPVGGTNPQPISATLTGTFNPVSVTSNGSPVTLAPNFSATISDTPFLADGDFAIINATPAVSATPEPGYWFLIAGGVIGLLILKYRGSLNLRAAFGPDASAAVKCLLAALYLVAVAHSAQAAGGAQVKLTVDTTPSSGVSGVTNVSITGSGFPAGSINPANIVVTFASSCDGPAVATAAATKITDIIFNTERVNFPVPGDFLPGPISLRFRTPPLGMLTLPR